MLSIIVNSVSGNSHWSSNTSLFLHLAFLFIANKGHMFVTFFSGSVSRLLLDLSSYRSPPPASPPLPSLVHLGLCLQCSPLAKEDNLWL